ncbi:hypothetical protein N431DRAFT_453743 [Stipitochalara longipes BDJ]|nr:hypothetical protein N431DRAFT_453743 [Stipitochalara longipes BDJ]
MPRTSLPPPAMSLDYSVETDSSCNYSDGSAEVPSPFDSGIYLQHMTLWEASGLATRADILNLQKKGLSHPNPTPFRQGNLPFEFMTTTLVSPQRVEGGLSERRRKQNRESQRAFRARERTRVQNLEERLETLTQQYRELKQAYLRLKIKNQTSREKVEVKEEIVDSNELWWQE